MTPRRWKVVAVAAVAGLSALALQASASAAGGRATTSAAAPTAAALPFPSSGETVFHPVNPTRILDTRLSLGGHLGKISSTAPLNLQVTGPTAPAGTTAVVFNVTVVAPTVSSFLTIWPTGAARPTFDNLSYTTGQTVTTASTVRLSADGKMTIRPAAGSAHVLIDITGYYAASTAWGESGYVAWVVADDNQIYGSHVNRSTPITKINIDHGVNTFTFPGANIPLDSHSVAKASIQVSAIGPTGSGCSTATSTVPIGNGTGLQVRVTCLRTDNLTPINAAFYLQVAG